MKPLTDRHMIPIGGSHGAVFNIKTGAVLGAPAPRGVASYPVRVQGADVEVEL